MVEVTKSDIGRRVVGVYANHEYTGILIGKIAAQGPLLKLDSTIGPCWRTPAGFYKLEWGSYADENNLYVDYVKEFPDQPKESPKSIFKPGDKVFITDVYGDHPRSDIGKLVTLQRTWKDSGITYWNYAEDFWSLKESNISTHAPMQTTPQPMPSFKFNIDDIVVLNNRGHQAQNLDLRDGPSTSCASDNAFAFESGAKVIKREYYPKEGRNWYQIEHKGYPYSNWISEDGLELFVAKSVDSSYTYKVGDVIRFRDTPNTRSYRNGASIGKTYTITGKEQSNGVRSINDVERGIENCWTTDGNEWGTNFKRGDIELLSKAKYDTLSGGVVSAKKPTIDRLMPSEKLPSNMYKELMTPEEVLERYGVNMQPSPTDIVYISKQKTKHKLLTF